MNPNTTTQVRAVSALALVFALSSGLASCMVKPCEAELEPSELGLTQGVYGTLTVSTFASRSCVDDSVEAIALDTVPSSLDEARLAYRDGSVRRSAAASDGVYTIELDVDDWLVCIVHASDRHVCRVAQVAADSVVRVNFGADDTGEFDAYSPDDEIESFIWEGDRPIRNVDAGQAADGG